MVRPQTTASLLIVAALILPGLGFYEHGWRAAIDHRVIAQEAHSQIADVSPSIYGWGIIGRPNASESFSVWANVTDDDGDLANVSIHVNGPNITLQQLMPFNGTFYVTELQALTEFGQYDLYVTATDLANHTRYGLHIYFEIQPEHTEPPDPSITMPYVVISSLGAAVLVIILAYVYRLKHIEELS